jgi:hypothetical protein
MFEARRELLLSGPRVVQLIGHDHAGHICQPLQELPIIGGAAMMAGTQTVHGHNGGALVDA